MANRYIFLYIAIKPSIYNKPYILKGAAS